MTDESLMTAYQKGSEEAFNRLYEKYSSMVYGFIKKRLRDSEADDFYQKVWRHLHEKRDLYKGQPFLPWFFVLIRHLLIDEYRTLGRKKERPMSDEYIDRMFKKSTGTPEEVEEFLKKLPPESADLVRKYYLEEVSYEELEKESGLSQTNLRQRLSRAVRSLRKGES
jgi:RNA polymerase sigma-70 factor (ECF subfamily)